jgi:hypothetical protein
MRIVTYGGAVSLDGFLAGADGSIDWLHFSKDVQDVMTKYWKDVDTILMGRKTYDFAVSSGREASTGEKRTKDKARKEPAVRTYVFSRTLQSIDEPGVQLVKGGRGRIRPEPQAPTGQGNLSDGRWRTGTVAFGGRLGGQNRLERSPDSARLRSSGVP